MGLRINNNIAAFNAYRNLSVTDTAMSKSLEKLSSGFRINRAADDAAGLAISEGLRSQIGGLKVGVRNAQDGISVVQTAEGALTESHAILQRMRDLAVQSANDGSQNAQSKTAANTEFQQLATELDNISKTSFNGQTLLDGTFNKDFQVGANQGEAERLFGPAFDPPPRQAPERVEHRLGGDAAGPLPGRFSAHAVGNREEQRSGDQTCNLHRS